MGCLHSGRGLLSSGEMLSPEPSLVRGSIPGRINKTAESIQTLLFYGGE